MPRGQRRDAQMKSARIYITQPIAQSAVSRLRAVGEVRVNPDPLHIATKEEMIVALQDCNVLFCMLHDRVDREIIEANPDLLIIASTTVTPVDIDVAAASARRIPVTVVPSALLDDATADLAWALLLCAARRVAECDRLMRAGVFPGSQSSYMEGAGVSGKTVGLVGMGGVGRASARRARGFGMRILYHDPIRLNADAERDLDLRWVTLDELLATSDFVSIHARLTPHTRHLLSDREFALMKPSAYLINTARGPIVDEQALVRAIAEGRIAGAGLDVYENEPQPSRELLSLQNVVFTPHVGSGVRELREQMANIAVDNILAVMAGRKPPNCWNREIYGKS
jgi:glyoxylate reductase